MGTLNLVKALPVPWMWVGMALLVFGGYFLGYTHGTQRGYDHAQALTQQVAAVGAQAQAEAIAKDKINAAITKETEHAYAKASAEIRRIYPRPAAPVAGLRYDAGTGDCGCRLPAYAAPAAGVDGDAENDLPDPATLAADCADTTLMLLHLQHFNASVE